MKPLILNLASLTFICATLPACHPDHPIPQPIMLYRTDLGSTDAHDAKGGLPALPTRDESGSMAGDSILGASTDQDGRQPDRDGSLQRCGSTAWSLVLPGRLTRSHRMVPLNARLSDSGLGVILAGGDSEGLASPQDRQEGFVGG